MNENSGSTIYVVGTAHILESTAKQVEEVINNVKPDTIMVELDAERAKNIMNKYENKNEKENNENRFNKFRNIPILGFIFRAILKNMYRSFESVGVTPGKEFIVAIQAANQLNAEVVLGDRNYKVTMTRLFKSMSLFKFLKRTFQSPWTLNEKDYSNMSNQPRLRDMFNPNYVLKRVSEFARSRDLISRQSSTFKKIYPEIFQVIVDERDIYMINQLRNCKGNTIVAVVGMGHLDGIQKYWDSWETRMNELKMTDKDLHQP